VLPVDPAADGLDLPVLMLATRVSAAGSAVDAETLMVARFLGIVGRLEPGLLGWVSEVGAHRGAVRLLLRSAHDAELLLPAEPTTQRLRELHLTLTELAAPRLVQAPHQAGSRAAGPELSYVRRIDARFHDQIVVALHQGKN
jgi:hypothetical protein